MPAEARASPKPCGVGWKRLGSKRGKEKVRKEKAHR